MGIEREGYARKHLLSLSSKARTIHTDAVGLLGVALTYLSYECECVIRQENEGFLCNVLSLCRFFSSLSLTRYPCISVMRRNIVLNLGLQTEFPALHKTRSCSTFGRIDIFSG